MFYLQNKCGGKRNGKNKRKWKVEPLIVSPPIASPGLSELFDTSQMSGLKLEQRNMFNYQ